MLIEVLASLPLFAWGLIIGAVSAAVHAFLQWWFQ